MVKQYGNLAYKIMNHGIIYDKNMKKFTETLKSLSKGRVEGKSMPAVLILILLGLSVVMSLPLLLIWGLYLIGLPVETSFSSWLGSVLILVFIKIASAKSETPNNNE